MSKYEYFHFLGGGESIPYFSLLRRDLLDRVLLLYLTLNRLARGART